MFLGRMFVGFGGWYIHMQLVQDYSGNLWLLQDVRPVSGTHPADQLRATPLYQARPPPTAAACPLSLSS